MSRTDRRLERLGSDVRRRVQGKVAVRENTGLQVPLTAIVDGLERDVAAVLERRTDRGSEPGMGS